MNAAILERFALPGNADHVVVIKNGHDADCICAECRIRRVMPAVVQKINAFRAGLRAREQQTFEVRDLCQEIWLELLLKAPRYDADRAAFITFAMDLTHKKLSEVRNRWHLVAGPRDTAAKLRSARSRPVGVEEKIRRTVREPSSLSSDPTDLYDEEHTPEAEAMRSERQAAAAATLRAALRQVALANYLHAMVLGLAYGLGGGDAVDNGRIAARLGLTIAQVVALKEAAERDLKRILTASPDAIPLDLIVA